MKTQINVKSASRNIIYVILGVLALIASAGSLELLGITNFINHPNPTASITQEGQFIDYNPPTTDQKSAAEQQKAAMSDVTPNNALGISISSLNTSGNTVQIRSLISGAVSNSGTCTLSLTQNSTTVKKTAGIYALPNSSTCEGFSISKTELGIGIWQFEISVNIADKQSRVSDSFNLE